MAEVREEQEERGLLHETHDTRGGTGVEGEQAEGSYPPVRHSWREGRLSFCGQGNGPTVRRDLVSVLNLHSIH